MCNRASHAQYYINHTHRGRIAKISFSFCSHAFLQKKNAALANGHAKPNGYCKSINAHDDLFMPQTTTTAAAASATAKANGNGNATLSNGHANGLKNGYKTLANGNAATSLTNGSAHKSNGLLLANGYGNGNGYATQLLDDVAQELTHRKTQK